MLDLLVQGGTIVDGQGEMAGSIGIADSRIVARFAAGARLPDAARVIDASGKLVLPGIVDPHVHFYGEGIGEYSKLAVRGGVTTFIGMIRGAPERPLAEVIDEHRRAGEEQAVTDFAFHVVLYDRPESVGQIAALAARGLRSFKLFMAYKRRGMMASDAFLFAALQEIRRVGGIALIHAEHGEMVDHLEQCAGAAGCTGVECYEPTRPPEAEAAAIEVLALAAQATGCPCYIVHLSSRAGLAAIEGARRRGVPLWAETCPQYLMLEDGALGEFGAAAKIAPPLRASADRRALRTALLTGAINTLGSDHASFTLQAKNGAGQDIFAAPFGMAGATTLWPATFTWAEEIGLPLPVLVRAMAETPARLFGLADRKGTLMPGADADLIIVDRASRRQIDMAEASPGMCPSPLSQRPLGGWPETTISRGEIVWHEDRCTAEPGRARFLEQGAS